MWTPHRAATVHALLLLSCAGCAPAPTLELFGVVEPTPACTTTAESPLVESGLLDLASATSAYVGLLRAQVNDPPADAVAVEFDFTEVGVDLPAELHDELDEETLTGGPTPDGIVLNPAGTAPGPLVGSETVSELAAAVARTHVLDDATARLELQLRVRLGAFGADGPYTSSYRLLSNEVPFTLELCMGCVPVLCEPDVTPCFAALTQPACLRDAL